MAQSPPLLVSATLFAIMFALGMGLPLDGLGRWRQHRRLLLRGLIGTCLLVPVEGCIALVHSFHHAGLGFAAFNAALGVEFVEGFCLG